MCKAITKVEKTKHLPSVFFFFFFYIGNASIFVPSCFVVGPASCHRFRGSILCDHFLLSLNTNVSEKTI